MRYRAQRFIGLTLPQAANYAGLVLFLTTILSVLYRYSWSGQTSYSMILPFLSALLKDMVGANDPSKCEALLTRGRWLDSPDAVGSPTLYENWQAQGCMMHRYQMADIQACLSQREIIFIGDSSVRQLFWSIARKLDHDGASRALATAERHTDLTFTDAAVTTKFYWDPFLNSTSLQEHVAPTSTRTANGSEEISATVYLIGGGLWHVRYLGDTYYEEFQNAISNIVNIMPKQTSGVPKITDRVFLFSPVQEPHYASLGPNHLPFDRKRVALLNEHLLQTAQKHELSVAWAYSLMAWKQDGVYDSTGLHRISTVTERMADVLLNLKCNTIIRDKVRYPIDKTCCVEYKIPNWTQCSIIALSMILPLGIVVAKKTGPA